MTTTSFASFDAYDPCADFGADDMVFWLQPQSATQARNSRNARAGHLFRLTASLSLSAFMSFGSISAAIAPAAARTTPADLALTPEPSLAPPLGSLEQIVETDPAELNEQRDIRESNARESEIANVPPSVVEAASVPGLDAILGTDTPIEIVARAPIPITAEPQASGSDAGGREAEAVEAAPEMALANVVIDYRPPPDLNELLAFDGKRVPRWLVETVLYAADATGVDPVYLMALADKESSFIPGNKAKSSSADGLFQFISSTWLEMVKKFGPKYGLAAEAAAIASDDGEFTIPDEATREHVLGLRRDAYLSALMAAEMLKRDRSRIEQRLGRPITRSEFYLAHFFGVESASRFMSLLDDKPKQKAPRFFPAAARANRALFFTKEGRKVRQLTVAEVYDKLDDMIDQRLDRYGDVRLIATANLSL
jgi:Transglycosylase SLT domain